ncbi:MAG: hypothetical protein KC431_10310, partial [Myxococcales bacterium]|nr:hypothetical protein [Myxococcales bacterium]
MATLTTRGNSFVIDGKPTRLVGYSNYGLLYHPEFNALERWLDHLASHGVNLMREWVVPLPEHWGKAVQPIVKRNNGKYDFTALEPRFWQFFHRLATEAGKRKIILEITLWDHYSMKGAPDFAHNPLHQKLGGFITPTANGTAFPDFYRPGPVRQAIADHSKRLLAELGKHWNIIIEPMNEPGRTGASADDVTHWHEVFYGWAKQVAPALPIAPNLVYEPLDANAPERIYPRFDHPDVAAVSLHAGAVSWQPDQPCSVASDVVTGVRN